MLRSGPNKHYKGADRANGKLLSMEIDTGASASFVWEKTFETIQKGESTLEIQRSSVRLQTYTGEAITVRRSALVPVQHNETLPLLMTAENGLPLPGHDWLPAIHLDWKPIFAVGTTLSLQ